VTKCFVWLVDVVQSDAKWELSSEVKSSLVTADLRGSLRTKWPNYLSSKLTASYTLRDGRPQTFDVAAKYDNQMRGALVRRSASFNVQVSCSCCNCQASHWHQLAALSYFHR